MASNGTHKPAPRPTKEVLAELLALEGSLRAESSAKEMQVWLSYLYRMRSVPLSGLMWGKFVKFMESRGLDILDPSYSDLPK